MGGQLITGHRSVHCSSFLRHPHRVRDDQVSDLRLTGRPGGFPICRLRLVLADALRRKLQVPGGGLAPSAPVWTATSATPSKAVGTSARTTPPALVTRPVSTIAAAILASPVDSTPVVAF